MAARTRGEVRCRCKRDAARGDLALFAENGGPDPGKGPLSLQRATRPRGKVRCRCKSGAARGERSVVAAKGALHLGRGPLPLPKARGRRGQDPHQYESTPTAILSCDRSSPSFSFATAGPPADVSIMSLWCGYCGRRSPGSAAGRRLCRVRPFGFRARGCPAPAG